MTDYIFSSVLGQTINFNAATDALVFLGSDATASGVTITVSGSNITFRTAAGAVTLSGVSLAQLTPTNVNFLDGSVLSVGDGTTDTISDVLGNPIAADNDGMQVRGLAGGDAITGGTKADLIFGNEGNDTIASGDGNDTVFGGKDVDDITGGNGNDLLYGNMGNDSITAGEGDDTVYGGQDNDEILGGEGNNWLEGNKGNDTLSAGAGNDTLLGGDGDDNLDGGNGANSINGGAGNDSLTGGTGNDTLVGGEGNDTIIGTNDGADLIYGNQGSDLIHAGSGSSTVFGGQGNDTIDAEAGSTLIAYGNLGDDSITGNDGNDKIYGGEGNDTLTGGAGADSVLGGLGNDTFNVAAGDANDYLDGGDGNDTFTVVTGNIAATTGLTLAGGANDDTFNVFLDEGGADKLVVSDFGTGDTLNVTTDATDVADVRVTVSGSTFVIMADNAGTDDQITVVSALSGVNQFTIDYGGAGGSDSGTFWVNTSSTGASVTGTSNGDYLHGGDGNDTLLGGAGTDIIFGGAGNDSIDGGTGVDTVDAGNGDDTVTIDSQTDVAYGGNGTDTALINTSGTFEFGQTTDNQGFEVVTVGNGATTDLRFNHADYNATVTGNTITVNAADGGALTVSNTAAISKNFVITGSAVADTIDITNATAAATISGGLGADVITGGAGADALDGGVGADTLIGGGGNDTLTGGAGVDYLTGSGGNDVFRFATSHMDAVTDATTLENNTQTISDFTDGTDKLMIQGVTSSFTFATAAADADATFGEVALLVNATASNSVTVIDLGADPSAMLNIGGHGAADAAANDALVVVNVAGTKYTFFLDGGAVPTLTWAGDFVDFA